MFTISNNENGAVHLLPLETLTEVEMFLANNIDKEDSAEYYINEVSVFMDIPENPSKEQLAKAYTYYSELKKELDSYIKGISELLTDGVVEKTTIGRVTITPTKGKETTSYGKFIKDNGLIVPDKYKTIGKPSFTIKVSSHENTSK